MTGDDLKMSDVKGRAHSVSRQIQQLLNDLTRETGTYVEYVEVEQIHTEDKGIVGYIVQLDVRLGRES